MGRLINLANSKDRSAAVSFSAYTAVPTVHYRTPAGGKTVNKKILKGTSDQTVSTLVKKYGDLDALAEALIAEDPEIDMETTGQFLEQTGRVYINEENKVVFRIHRKEYVYLPDGSLKEEREPRQMEQNINGEDKTPIKWSGKSFPKNEVFRKFIFARKYQLKHTNSLSYDFLYGMAKELADSQTMMLVGSGAKGIGPLVFQDGGTPFRAFLEGRIDGENYLLLLHLSNLELKALPRDPKE